MALGDVIARMSVVLGLDTAAFEKGATQAQKQTAQLQKKFAKMGDQISDIGRKMTVGLTAPIAAAGFGIIKASSNFEEGLNNIKIATNATSDELAQMSELALKIGKDTTFGATEAAGAMELLAKAGIGTKEILGGAAKAVTDLAAAAGSELDPAASAISDSMNQFKLTATDLPLIVNQITGAVNESKFDFEDFTGGMAQAGGVAASAGLSFKDFATTLAATSSQFASGSDAGTSLKTFLLALTPTTKKAANAMHDYGLEFFDAAGKMRPIGEIAEMLRVKFAGLDDETRNATFKEIFGTDAIRTAVGLMNQGADGLERIQAALDKTSAADQASARMKTFNGQLDQLKGSLETLAIKLGQSGILEALTSLASAASGFIDTLTELNPEILKWATIFAAVVAAIGPLLIGIGAVVSAVGTMLPAIIAVSSAIGALSSIIIAGAIPAIASLVVALAPILIPLALVAAAVTAVYLAWKNWDKIVAIVTNLVNKVDGLIQGNLTNILKAVLNPIDAVRKGFARLYDAVVGHSYIPDMVDGIAREMARLDAVMVRPAEKAAAKTTAAFRKLAEDVKPLLSRLFPEAAARNQFDIDASTLDRSAKAGIISPEQADEGKRRASLTSVGLDPTSDYGINDTVFSDVGQLPIDMDAVNASLERLADTFKDVGAKVSPLQAVFDQIGISGEELKQDLARAFTDAVLGAKSFGDALRGVFNRLAEKILDKAFENLLGSVLGGVIPGFASGTPSAPRGLAWVGESGPELVNFSGGERVYNNRDSERMMTGGTSRPTTININTPVDQRSGRMTAMQLARVQRQENFRLAKFT